ncbi:hypothetical protein PIB30_097478, partial [Stylosanthes scabra]|nr:hypothetical protein [Stylosanthes scabra]
KPHVVREALTYNVENAANGKQSYREPTLYVSSPTYNVANSNFHEDFKQKPHVIRGSYTYNVEVNFKSSILSNSNSNPRSFGINSIH